MEAINKALELIKQLVPLILGWFSAKQNSKINNLKEENETLKKFNEIDTEFIDVDVFDARVWK